MEKFKPCLTPNFPVGEYIDWNSILGRVSNWVVSEKLDGVRIELYMDDEPKTRSLKPFKSRHIKDMAKRYRDAVSEYYSGVILEAEIWAPGLTFEEIKSFVSAHDITSEKHIKRLRKEYGTKNWKFPGRTVEFMSTWPKDLKFYVFDCYDVHQPNLNKLQRIKVYKQIVEETNCDLLVPIKQVRSNNLLYIKNWYNKVVENGGEGLMLVKGNSRYKFGRYTLKQNMAYKMKDNKKEFEAEILDVMEGTVVMDDVPKTINELGYSRTSQSIFDRVPSGKAKGLLCKVKIGNYYVAQTVSLAGFDDRDKERLLNNKEEWIGKKITVVGMKPTIPHGKVRGCFYVR